MDYPFMMLVGIVLLAYTTQVLAGFGSVIISVTLGVHFYPIEFLLPVLVPLDVIVNSYIISKHYKHVHKKLLLNNILPLMGFGLIIGIFLFNYLQGNILKMAFGVFVTLVSITQLIAVKRNKENHNRLSPLKSSVLLFSGGLVQGIYASGGPMIAYAVGRLNLTKSIFRSTLCALWIILNAVLTASYAVAGKLSAETLKYLALLLPVVITGIVIGELFHNKINENQFKIFIYSILVVAGISIVFG